MPDIHALIARSASEEAFRSRLISDPGAVLHEEGFDLPANMQVEVVETRPDEIHLELGEQNRPPKLQAILDRAEGDLAFRKQFLKSPNRVIEDAMGTNLPPGTAIHVHEPLENGIRVFLPPLQSAHDSELSDAQLGAVAGGTTGGLLNRIGEWFCRDTRVVEGSFDGGKVTGVTLYTSRNPGKDLRQPDTTL